MTAHLVWWECEQSQVESAFVSVSQFLVTYSISLTAEGQTDGLWDENSLLQHFGLWKGDVCLQCLEGRDGAVNYFLGSDDDPPWSFSASYRATGLTHCEAVFEHPLYCDMAKHHHKLFVQRLFKRGCRMGLAARLSMPTLSTGAEHVPLQQQVHHTHKRNDIKLLITVWW